MSTAKAATRPKVAECRRAERAARGVTLRRLHLLMDALKEVGDVRLRRGKRGLDSTLCCAPLAEVEQTNACPLYLGELNHRIRFLAHIANHLSTFLRRVVPAPAILRLLPASSYDHATEHGFTELAALEQQNTAGARGEPPVMSHDDHTDLEVIHDLHQ